VRLSEQQLPATKQAQFGICSPGLLRLLFGRLLSAS
jgi:hypothetical protein